MLIEIFWNLLDRICYKYHPDSLHKVWKNPLSLQQSMCMSAPCVAEKGLSVNFVTILK